MTEVEMVLTQRLEALEVRIFDIANLAEGYRKRTEALEKRVRKLKKKLRAQVPCIPGSGTCWLWGQETHR